jgi:hypothetical protein
MNENSATVTTKRANAKGRTSRIRARSALAAVAVMVTALAAFLGTAQPGFAAVHQSSAVAGQGICIISARSADGCDSTDRELIVDSTNTGDTEACTFTWKIYWGDGTTQMVTDDGAPADLPTLVKAIHFYKEPRETTMYDVYWDAVSVTGGCYIGSGNSYFILVVPPR